MKRICYLNYLLVLAFSLFAFTASAQITVYPYTEDFETEGTCGTSCTSTCTLTGDFTNNTSDDKDWAVDIGGTGSSSTGPSADNTLGTSAGKYLYTEASSCFSKTAHLESPVFDFTALTNPVLEFYYHMYGQTMGSIEISVSTNGGMTWSAAIWSISGQQHTASADPYTKATVSLCNYGGMSSVMFRITGITGSDFYSDMAIDDITVQNVAGCVTPAVTGVSSLTATGGTIAWSDVCATSYDWEVVPAGNAQGVGVVASGNTASLSANATGLMSNTAYDVFVRANCTGGSSSYSSASSFLTTCAAFTAPFTESFSASSTPSCWFQSSVSGDAWKFGTAVDFGSTSTVRPDALGNSGEYANIDFSDDPDTTALITPMIDVSGLTTPRLTFYYNSQTNSTLVFSPYNRLIVDYWDGNNWVNITVIDVLTPAGWTKYTFNASAYTFNGNLVQFRFSAQEGGAAVPGGTGTGTYDQDLMLDEVVVEETPSCLAPSGLTVSNLMTTSADLGWTENGTATIWDIEYGMTGFTPTGTPTITGTTTNPHALTALSSNTTYDFYVRADCGLAQSAWVGPYTFATPCNAYTVPYSEGFESGYANGTAVGGCLSQESVSGGNTWEANNTQTSYNRSPRTGAWNAYLRWGNEDWIFIPIDLTGGKNYKVELYARQDGSTTTNADVAISYGAMNTAAAMTNSIVTATGIDDNYQLIGGAFTPTTTGTYYVGIKGYMNSSPWYISLDDISIYELVPNDATITAVNAGNCSSTESVTIDITNNGTSAQTTIPVSYSVNGGAAVNETWTGTLAAGATAQYTFTATFDASAAGNYSITANTALVGDQNTTNDTTIRAITTAPVYATALFEDFEGGALPTDWSTNGGLIGSGHNAASNVIYRNMYSTGTADFTTTLPKVGPIVAGDSLMFDYRYSNWSAGTVGTALGAGDTLNVQISTDCGQTFTTIHQIHQGNHVTSAASARSKHDISMYAGQTVVARIAAVRATGDYYLDLDNFFVGARLAVTATETSPISCNGVTDGEATAVNAGGVAPFTYLWDDAMAQTTMTATNLGTGMYSVTVVDALGDTITSSVTLAEPMVLGTGVMGTNISCIGGNDGMVDLTVTGGTAPYTYTWSNGDSTEDATGLGLGSFDVLVVDANGCTAQSTSVTITQPSGISSSASWTDATCNGDSTGSAQVNVSGGTAPYSYAWSNGDTTASVSGLPAGAYTLAITDANGCIVSVSTTINEPTAIMIADSITDASCNGAMDGNIMTTITGGAGAYSMTWSSGVNPAAVGAGTYMVTVADADGCTTTASYTVNEPTAVTGMTSVAQSIACAGDTGAVAITASGGVGPYTFVWTDAAGNPVDGNSVTAGDYTANIIDATGCIGSETVSITEPIELVVTATTMADTNNLMIGEAMATVTGGTQPYTSISWDNGMTGASISGLGAGTYIVTVMDVNGCTAEASVVVDSVFTNVAQVDFVTNLKVFPNPTVGNLTIDLELSEAKDVNVVIYDMTGQLVRDFGHEYTAQTQIRTDLSDFPSGIYLVRFVLDNQVITKRLIVSKR